MDLAIKDSPLPKFIAIEGPIGVGKTTLAHKLAKSFNYDVFLEQPSENPFLGKFYMNQNQSALPTQLFFLFQRIQQIEDIIARANVIDVTKIENLGKVIFGSTVYLKDLDSNEKLTYKIVGKDEADLKKNLIFFKSPIGKALIGKNKSEMVVVNTPSGEKNFEILDVEYI